MMDTRRNDKEHQRKLAGMWPSVMTGDSGPKKKWRDIKRHRIKVIANRGFAEYKHFGAEMHHDNESTLI